ncbi:MAG: nuclear protein DGCR14 [Linnemannia elongata]|nr:MAG: nuclear protein DGCR14 [Linnemannia elongata]
MSSHIASNPDTKPTSSSAITTVAKKAGSGGSTTALTRARPVYKSNIPAPAPQVILEEDDYIEALSKIIERDFFPDLARLKRQHAYLDAVEQNDSERIQAAARELAGNDTPLAKRRLKTPARTPRFDRAGLPDEAWTPARLDGAQATPSWGDHEPATPAFPGPIDTPMAETPSQSNLKSSEEETVQDAIDTSLSLDQFQMRYTSEDNASFNEIIEKINAQKKEKYKWLYDQEKKSIRFLENGNNNQEQRLLREAGESGEGSSNSQALVRVGDGSKQDGPSKLELALADNRSGVISTWEYKAKNSLMYAPEGLGTNLDEKLIRGNPKEIVHRNTSLQGQDLLIVNQTAAAKFDPTPYMKGNNVTDTPKVAGFSFVSSTPSPSMSTMGDDPEMMTWGTIEDEPLLISSGVQSSGPSPFKLPPTPRRELIAQKLSEKASKSFRAGSSLRAKVFASPSASALAQYRESMGGTTPTPRFNSPYGVASPAPFNKTPGGPSSQPTRLGSPNPRARAEMLSPAARSLLDKARSKRGTDQQLRSSYGNATPGSSSTLRQGSVTPSPLTKR